MPPLPGGTADASAISFSCGESPTIRAQPFDGAAGAHGASRRHRKLPVGLDRTLDIAAAKELRVIERLGRCEEKRLGRADAVDRGAGFAEPRGERADDVVVAADGDDRRAGKPARREHIAAHRTERCAACCKRRRENPPSRRQAPEAPPTNAAGGCRNRACATRASRRSPPRPTGGRRPSPPSSGRGAPSPSLRASARASRAASPA